MKVIERLPTRKVDHKSIYESIFECPECHNHVKRSHGTGNRQKTCGCIGVSNSIFVSFEYTRKKQELAKIKKELHKENHIPNVRTK